MVKFYKNILKLKRYLFEIQWIVGVQCLYLYQVNRRFEKARAEKKPIYVCIYLIIIFLKQATELSQDQSKYKLFKNQITFFVRLTCLPLNHTYLVIKSMQCQSR